MVIVFQKLILQWLRSNGVVEMNEILRTFITVTVYVLNARICNASVFWYFPYVTEGS